MAIARTALTTFSSGELDPGTRGRTDIKHYLQGCLRLRNFRQLAQGGVSTRPGTDRVAEIEGYGRCISFAYSETQQYIMVFSANTLKIWGGPDWSVLLQELETPYTEQQCKELDYDRQSDTMIVVHQDVIQQRITRLTASSFSIADIAYDYNKDEKRLNQPYHQFVRPDAHLVLNGVAYVAGTSVTCGAYTNDGSDAFNDLWNVGHIGLRFQILDAGDSTFKEFLVTAIHPSGVLNNATVTLKDDFTVTAATQSINWGEPLYSSVRGWASCALFREGRLWMNGSPGRPGGLVASKIEQFFNFDVGIAKDDDSISFSIVTTGVNRIQYLVSGRDMTIMTDGAELYTTVAPGETITPSNMNAKPQTYYGIKRVKPWVFDSAIIFAQRGDGKNIREYHYKDLDQSYSSSSISILAGHLIENPVDSATLTSSAYSEQYAYFVMENGSMAVFHSIREEEVRGWSLWYPGVSDPGLTSGSATFNNSSVTFASQSNFMSQLDLYSSMITGDKFLSAASVNDSLFVTVRRKINGVNKYFLERFNNDRVFDSAETRSVSTPSRLFSGLNAFAGHTVAVRSRNTFLGLYDVSLSGVIELPLTIDAQVQIEVGLPFLSYMTPMPFDARTNDRNEGSLTGRKRRVSKLTIELIDTLSLKVSNEVMLLRNVTDSMSSQPRPKSGPQEFRLLGYSRDPTLTLTLDEPMKATILSMQAELAY
jgi:hypothetical protein